MSKKEQTILEEAAYKYSFESRPSVYGQVDVIDAFKAGAEWLQSQMLKDAMEGEVIYDLGGFFRIKSEAIDGAKYKVGSWVKLIIVKEG